MKRFADTNSASQDAPGGPGRGVSLARRLAALAEPAHLRLLRVLEREELTVGEVAKVLQTAQSTASRRLKALADAGWLAKRAEGAATFYRLTLDDMSAEARQLWTAVRGQIADASGGEKELSAAQLRADLVRLDAVLSERATDSYSFFGRVAGEWDAIRTELFGASFTARGLLGLLPPHWTVADLGCGTGNASEHLAPMVERVVAVDQSAPMLKAAKKRLSAFGNVEFVRGELTALPLADASVDAAVCILVLHHVEDPASAVREMGRVLRPGGVALVVDMQEHDRAFYRTSMGHKHLGFSEGSIRSMFRGAGLVEARVAPLPTDPESKGPVLVAATARRGAGPTGDKRGRPTRPAPAE
jgi:ArsR family transcriptional regulator